MQTQVEKLGIGLNVGGLDVANYGWCKKLKGGS
jgi:hypothetical protein